VSNNRLETDLRTRSEGSRAAPALSVRQTKSRDGTEAIAVFSVFAAAGAVCLRWRTQRSRSWPTVEAHVIEISPTSIFEREESQFYLNLDSDYFIEYEAAGKSYRRRIIEDNARVVGIKVWRRKMPKRLVIRYNPENPADYVDPTYDFGWLLLACVAVLGFGIFLVLHMLLSNDRLDSDLQPDRFARWPRLVSLIRYL
jgi:hypothetical protein